MKTVIGKYLIALVLLALGAGAGYFFGYDVGFERASGTNRIEPEDNPEGESVVTSSVSISEDQATWKSFDSVTDGGINKRFHFVFRYPRNWFEDTACNDAECGTIIADYDLYLSASEDGTCVRHVYDRTGCSRPGAFHRVIPEEHCSIIFPVSSRSSTSIVPLRENTYVNEQDRDICEGSLDLIMETFEIITFTPFSPEEIEAYDKVLRGEE